MSDTTPGSFPGGGEHDESILGSDPLATARALQGALEGMTTQLADVKKTVRRGKLVVIGLIISLIIDAAVTVVVSITAVQAHHASTQANATVSQLHRSQLQGCRLNNARLARESSMWPYVESLLKPPPNPTPGQYRQSQEIIAGLKAHARRAYAPRNCAAAYKLP